MDHLPPGWIQEESFGRTVFFSPPPGRIKIDCLATLKYNQRKGKFLNVTSLNFKRKKMIKQAVKKVDEKEVFTAASSAYH